MPDPGLATNADLSVSLERIRNMIYAPVGRLKVQAWCTKEPVPFARRRDGTKRSLSVGDVWGNLFDCAWFHFTGTVPAQAAGGHVVLLLDVNGEMCVYDGAGTPVRGLTTAASAFDVRLGRPGKRVLELSERAQAGEQIDIWADAGCNDLFGNLQGNGTIEQAEIATCNDEARNLYYDFEVLLDLVEVLPETDAIHDRIRRGLRTVTHILSGSSPGRLTGARDVLAPLLAAGASETGLQISAIGHAHIDLAWLWPIRETIRKGVRTFATALDLMRRYPDYRFGSSQPQLFAWIKDTCPPLYRRIAARVQEGRIEPLGAMWVEADTNIPSGESLVRQLLLGKRFFTDEFNADVNVAWLPDVFGYSAALPGILKRAGVDYFFTQKLSWNLVNTFPFHSFRWTGIDGSTVLAHMFPEATYNSPAAPRSAAAIARTYREKRVSHHSLMVYGIGDGGGGPGAEHLERLSRMKNLEGLPQVTQRPVRSFIEAWSLEAEDFPTWMGELYLERHQGTLTTQAASKRANREIEILLREWELISVVAHQVAGKPYPKEELSRIWHEVLLYQFHDILPGSSIKRVYDESLERYATLSSEIRRGIKANLSAVAAEADTSGTQSPVVVFNSLSWSRREWIRAGETWLQVEVPAMGYVVVDSAEPHAVKPAMTADSSSLENDLLRVRFDDIGAVVSIFDKENGREALSAGEPANRLAVYADTGDAWDFPPDYRQTEPKYMALVSAVATVDGPLAVVEQVYRFGHSEVVQRISVTAGSRRIDFATRATWREPASMLRTSFPVAVRSDEATFEIQYGHIRRPTHCNTTWDAAKDEVAAHRWADLSGEDYGVALLNDSKYGHRVKGHCLDLNLIRSVPYPGPGASGVEDVPPGAPDNRYTDQCAHVFTYSLFPHGGDHVTGGVIGAAYALNNCLQIVTAAEHPGSGGRRVSFLQVESPAVVIDAVKMAEDGADVIVRMYEARGQGAETNITSTLSVRRVFAVNLLEEEPSPLPTADGAVHLTFGPFEIKTIRIETSR